MSSALDHKLIDTNDVRLHVVQAGPEAGPLVILLHGFPEFWYGWRKQIPALALAGYRVWAPDQRGYNLSEKPKGIEAYNLDELSADVIGLIDAAGRDQAMLVGHDWGAAVAWWTANKHPERLSRLGILNVPHHAVMRHHLRRNPAQRRKSWYMFFFQVPWLPEMVARAGNWRVAEMAMRRSGHGRTFSAEDINRYRRSWAQPGAATGMINWYRALRLTRPKRLPSPRIAVPTLVIWGAHDVALGREMAQPSVELCDDGRLEFIDDATHWVQHDAPERVNALLLDFLVGTGDNHGNPVNGSSPQV